MSWVMTSCTNIKVFLDTFYIPSCLGVSTITTTVPYNEHTWPPVFEFVVKSTTIRDKRVRLKENFTAMSLNQTFSFVSCFCWIAFTPLIVCFNKLLDPIFLSLSYFIHCLSSMRFFSSCLINYHPSVPWNEFESVRIIFVLNEQSSSRHQANFILNFPIATFSNFSRNFS